MINVNLQGLFEALSCAKEDHRANRLRMRTFISDDFCDADGFCGTSNCIVGSVAIKRDQVIYYGRPHMWAYGWLGGSWLKLCREIAGSDLLGAFLFANHRGRSTSPSSKDAQNLTADEAIRRLEKTIAYFVRKQSIWETEPERMRNQEGNWGFVNEASKATVPQVA